jgi:hypothetical protein
LIYNDCIEALKDGDEDGSMGDVGDEDGAPHVA